MNTRSQTRSKANEITQVKTMDNLETELNQAIQSRGFRISERLPLKERLERYIDLSCRSRVDLDNDELKTVSNLILMKYSSTEPQQQETNKRRRSPRLASQ
jgi:hypothetical protein